MTFAIIFASVGAQSIIPEVTSKLRQVVEMRTHPPGTLIV